jgi:hypothetical protein
MPVPGSISALSETPASNSPQGSESVGPNMNAYLQAAYAFIKQLADGNGLLPSGAVNMNSQQINNLAAGVVNTDAVNVGQLANYLPLAGGAVTGATSFAAAVTIGGAAGSLTIVNASQNA